MSVHYKFKSNLNYDTVTFDGLHISVADLKKSIMQQKKIGKSSDFDLQITNAQTKEVYDKDETLVPKNTSVIVARIPVATGNKKNWEKPELPLPVDNDGSPSGHIRFDKSIKSADLANSNVTEDDKVKAMIIQSSQEYDPSKYVKSRSMTGPLPPSYTCYRCGKQGHWIKNCPTNNPDVKRSTGIPRSFMVPVDGPEHKGALLTSSGEYAVPIIDHQAYKEVKKEKPPFVMDAEIAPEPDAEIPDELLCMFCKNLLQDAVLIPCCANSFCDDCVRQALLDSDNHECPVCHETGISPDTVIPNRFLRTAVHNFKNESGYNRVRKLFPPPETAHIDSPQPSPDSTVETQPPPVEIPEEEDIDTKETEDFPSQPVKVEQIPETQKIHVISEESLELTQPGTPLADELEEDMTQPLPIEIVGGAQYEESALPGYSGHYSQGHSHHPPESYEQDPRDMGMNHSQISTIETITNVRKRLPPMSSRQNYTSQMPHHRHDRLGDYESRDRPDYRSQYDRRNINDRQSSRSGMRPHSRYESSRYHHSEGHHDYHNYKPSRDYDLHSNLEQSRRRHRYLSPPPQPQPSTSYGIDVLPSYSQSAAVASARQPSNLLSHQATFPPQPPPPGASPIDSLSHIPPQPPPPGVGPLLPTPPSTRNDSESNFGSQSFKGEDGKAKNEERSIDDRIEAFQRELEKRGRESVRDRSSRSRSRSRTRKRSRSSSRSSHSRSYNSSKSWTRSNTRSHSRSRSRSRSSYSSRRSRSRSFSRSRSRSRSKSRSVSRSHSRSRSKSRSHSRERRRSPSRERLPTPFSRSQSDSHSPSPRNFQHRLRRSPYPPRRNIKPIPYNNNYAPPFSAPSALPAPASYPPTHVHSISQQPIAHPIDHYSTERQRYQYNEQYTNFDSYQHVAKPYSHPRFERDQRNQRFEVHEYHRRVEEVHHRIPGWVGDGNRQDYKVRYRAPRDQQRKEIKELPKVSEFESLPARAQKSEVRVKEYKEEVVPKKKEEKQSLKHKKHHHRVKETKKVEKHEGKVPYEAKVEKSVETSNLISVEVLPEKELEVKKISAEQKMKLSDKPKEKKHKHKKHKLVDSASKKKKALKKEKADGADASVPVKVKSKKKKNKLKATSECKKKEKAAVKQEDGGEITETVALQENDDNELDNNCDNLKVEPLQDTNVLKSCETLPIENLPQVTDGNTPEEPGFSDSDIITTKIESEEAEMFLEETTDVGSLQDNFAEDYVPDEDENIEEEEEERKEELHVEVPELSKWEREEFEEDILSRPQRKSAIVIPKEEKELLSSDIIQRAEKVILHKPLKTAIVVTSSKEKATHKSEKNSSKTENSNNNSTSRSSKFKEQVEPKSASAEKTATPLLQVTISNDKEKRSVQTKDNGRKEASKIDGSSKRVKLDRSHFTSVATDAKSSSLSHRTVVVEPWANDSKKSDDKRRIELEKTKSRASEYKARDKSSYHHKDDYGNSGDYNRDSHYRDRKYGSDDRRSRDRYDSRRQMDHYERNRRQPDYGSSSRDKRYADTSDSYRSEDRRDSRYRRSRSRSYASSGSYESRRHHSKKVSDTQYDRGSSRQEDADSYDRSKSSRRFSPDPKRDLEKKSVSKKDNTRETPLKFHSRQISQDESKFEPDYDEFSDHEPDSKEAQNEKHKQAGSDASEINQKRSKYEKASTSSASQITDSKEKQKLKRSLSASSVSSSSESDSDSSNDEEKVKSKNSDCKQKHKKSRHKKHKKHKHKHKKRKSHKSKQKD